MPKQLIAGFAGLRYACHDDILPAKDGRREGPEGNSEIIDAVDGSHSAIRGGHRRRYMHSAVEVGLN